MKIEKLMYWFSKPVVLSYSSTMLKLDIRMEQPLPKGPKIIAANHPSTTDPFFVACMVRKQTFILINDVLFHVPVLGEYLRRSGHIPVQVGNGPAALETALQRLKEGKTIIIFPEGDLSPEEGGFQKPRTGVARLALASGAPVIPVGIHLERKRIRSIRSMVEGVQHIGRWYIRGPYNMTIGEPLTFKGDVENRPLVRTVASSIMHNIIEMARLSEIRMNSRPTPLATLPEMN